MPTSHIPSRAPSLVSRFLGPVFSHDTYQRRSYMPELDGLRALAVALVITCHLHTAMWAPLSGYVGVTLFFVLSGYLITRLAMREEAETGHLNLKAFFVRRSLRIFPLYYLFVAIYCFLLLQLRLWPEKIEPFRQSLAYYIGYFQEIPFWRASQGLSPAPFYHTWSLGIEEKFYLLWPLFLVFTFRVRQSIRLGIAAVATIAFIIQGIVTEKMRSYHLESYGFILMGACLAMLLSRQGLYVRFNRLRALFFPIAIIVAIVVQFVLMPYTHFRGLSTLYATAVSMMLGALVSARGPADHILSKPGLVLMGRLSYGIYLGHILCLGVIEHFAKPNHGRLVGALAYIGTLVLSFIVAYILHHTVELPLIAIGRRISKRLIISESSSTEGDHTTQTPTVPLPVLPSH